MAEANNREIRMGWRDGPGKGREYPVAKNQYFHRRGGHFVYLHNGAASLVASVGAGDAKVMGWLEPPKDASGKSAWKSSATNKKDKCFVITGLENTFVMPAHEGNASVGATLVGWGAGLFCDTTATYGIIQQAKVGCKATASPLTVVDWDREAKLLYVKIKPAWTQAI